MQNFFLEIHLNTDYDNININSNSFFWNKFFLKIPE